MPDPAACRRSARHGGRDRAPRSGVPIESARHPSGRRSRCRQSGRGSGPSRGYRDASSETAAACGGRRGRRLIVSIPSCLQSHPNAKSPDVPGGLDIATGTDDVSPTIPRFITGIVIAGLDPPARPKPSRQQWLPDASAWRRPGHPLEEGCMRPSLLNPLFAPVTTLAGVGPKQDKLLRYLLSRNETPRLVDLLLHLPASVIDRRARPKIRDAVQGNVGKIG